MKYSHFPKVLSKTSRFLMDLIKCLKENREKAKSFINMRSFDKFSLIFCSRFHCNFESLISIFNRLREILKGFLEVSEYSTYSPKCANSVSVFF